MTKELKDALDRELETAYETGDARLIDRALINTNKAVADCQMKMAERVKSIYNDHPVLVNDVKEIKAIVERAKSTAWQIGLNAVKWILLGGGATEFIRYLATKGS